MGVPAVQFYRVARHIIGQRLRGRGRYPLVLMLEPLFKCNLSCAGCGKISYSQDILNKVLTTAECLEAVDECGAPVVSIGGGEPLLHPQMSEIVSGIINRRRFVYLCTNAQLLKKKIDDYSPSPYFTFSVHLDGSKERHDASARCQGAFDRAVEGIALARKEGFRVTVNCTLFDGITATEAAEFFDFVTALGVEGITVAPGFSYERASCHDIFLKRRVSKQLFRDIFALGGGRARKWKFNHTVLYLDFLAGNQEYRCTPWGSPTRNIFGWQIPCYLLVNEGSAVSYQSLLNDTKWDAYGVGRNPKCMHCMLHCGFEPTAVNDSVANPFKALKVFLKGPATSGPMVGEPEAHVSEADNIVVEKTTVKAGRRIPS